MRTVKSKELIEDVVIPKALATLSEICWAVQNGGFTFNLHDRELQSNRKSSLQHVTASRSDFPSHAGRGKRP